jgi:hypothetical protein
MDGVSGDRFGARLLQGSAPLMVWAVQLFGSYVLVAAACCTAFSEMQWFGTSALRVLLLALGALALAAIGVLLLRSLRGPAGLLRTAGTVSAVLALTGVAWATFPSAMLPLCVCR